MSEIKAWLKLFSRPGDAVEFVVSAEGYTTEFPPTETTRSITDPCFYYTLGEDEEGGRFAGVGPGAIKIGQTYYTAAGRVAYDPTGTAQDHLFDQIANPT